MTEMGFMSGLKLQKAARAQNKGDTAEAKRLYAEAFSEGAVGPRFVLAYAVLLIREGEYQTARDFLVKHQKEPGIAEEQKSNLFMYYAICCYKLGEVDKGVHYLELQHQKGPTGNIYQTLGYLYVEKFAGKKDTADPEEIAKGLAYNQEAVEYDDEDPVCLDNLGQYYYRVLEDREQAKTWFDRAIAQKENQIDTLWFLSRYDVEKGDRAAALKKLELAAEGRISVLNYCTLEMIQAEIARLKEA